MAYPAETNGESPFPSLIPNNLKNGCIHELTDSITPLTSVQSRSTAGDIKSTLTGPDTGLDEVAAPVKLSTNSQNLYTNPFKV